MSYSSIESLRHSVDNCQNRDALSPNKKIGLYEVARIDPELPIENIMINLITLRDEGKYMDIACRNINQSQCMGIRRGTERSYCSQYAAGRRWF
ncbi:hypothetical protein F5890DRAFT_1539778, partial [Lentinula detonsa]